MALIKPAFEPQRLEEERAKDKRTVMSVSLNQEEQAMLEECKQLLEESKDSSALKQMFIIGYQFVIHDPATRAVLAQLFKNKARNEREGIPDFE